MMRKILCLMLAVTLAFIPGSVCFAAEGDTVITDAGAPGAPAENVDEFTYTEQETNITDEDVAGGSAVSDLNEEKPEASALPKTGGIPAEAFYAAGALFIAAALIISRKRAKPASKN